MFLLQNFLFHKNLYCALNMIGLLVCTNSWSCFLNLNQAFETLLLIDGYFNPLCHNHFATLWNERLMLEKFSFFRWIIQTTQVLLMWTWIGVSVMINLLSRYLDCFSLRSWIEDLTLSLSPKLWKSVPKQCNLVMTISCLMDILKQIYLKRFSHSTISV